MALCDGHEGEEVQAGDWLKGECLLNPGLTLMAQVERASSWKDRPFSFDPSV